MGPKCSERGFGLGNVEGLPLKADGKQTGGLDMSRCEGLGATA